MSETIEIVRDDFVYKVHIEQDIDAENPRDWDQIGNSMLVYSSYGYDVVEDATPYGEALYHFAKLYGAYESDAVVDAFNKWVAITGNSSLKIFSGTKRGYSQSDWFDYYVIVDTGEFGLEAEEVANDCANEYATWRWGDVEMFILEGPDGEMIDSCSGFYDRDSMNDRDPH